MADQTTWVSVVDTAVKIGLGALIAALSTYFISKRAQKHEISKEHLKRRQDIIENISASFEAIHSFFMEVCVNYSSLSSVINAGLDLSTESREKLQGYMKKIGESFKELHILEGKLLLVDAPSATRQLRTYRLHTVKINDMIRWTKPAPGSEEIRSLLNELHHHREELYKALSTAYKTPSTIAESN